MTEDREQRNISDRNSVREKGGRIFVFLVFSLVYAWISASAFDLVSNYVFLSACLL